MNTESTSRADAVASLLGHAAALTTGRDPTRDDLDAIALSLRGLAAQPALWNAADFPDPAEGQQQVRYLVHEEPDHSLALYLMAMRKGKRTPIHNHMTWACIAAVEGAETNYLYRRLDDGQRPGHARIEPAGSREVRPGQSLSFMPQDIHAVSIEGDELIRHLHLYGKALETLHDRVVFSPDEERCAPMLIHSPTLRRLAGDGHWLAMGDRMVDGQRWGYLDTQKGERVLLMLPGAQGNCRSFDAQLEVLARHFRVIALSYPALGDAALLADGVLGLMDAMGIRAATVFGTSLGGYVAQWLAARRPGFVERLVLANTFVDPAPAQDPVELERVRGMSDHAYRQEALNKLLASPEGRVRDRMLAMVRSQPGDTLRQRRIAVLSGPPAPHAAIDDTRIVVVDSADDPVLPATMRAQLLSRYPQAVHHGFAAGGHSLHVSRIDDMNRILCGC